MLCCVPKLLFIVSDRAAREAGHRGSQQLPRWLDRTGAFSRCFSRGLYRTLRPQVDVQARKRRRAGAPAAAPSQPCHGAAGGNGASSTSSADFTAPSSPRLARL